MKQYTLRNFTKDRLARVSREWAIIAGEEEFEVELAPVFDWCSGHLVHIDGDAHAMEVYDAESGNTDLILEMVNGKRGALSKLLKIHLSPRFWAASKDDDLLEELIDAYASTIVSVIDHGIDGGFDEIKIYGRTDAVLGMLQRLQAGWVELGTTWTASMQGRWISISRAQKRV